MKVEVGQFRPKFSMRKTEESNKLQLLTVYSCCYISRCTNFDNESSNEQNC